MIKEIVKNIKVLHQKTELVKEGEDISQILTDLRDTFKTLKGYGLAGCQIGYNKQIALVEFRSGEVILINPKILEKQDKFEFKGEACFSFPGLFINTDRWKSIIFETGFDSDRKRFSVDNLESIIIQHEYDHLNGITILNRKHRAK